MGLQIWIRNLRMKDEVCHLQQEQKSDRLSVAALDTIIRTGQLVHTLES